MVLLVVVDAPFAVVEELDGDDIAAIVVADVAEEVVVGDDRASVVEFAAGSTLDEALAVTGPVDAVSVELVTAVVLDVAACRPS